MTKWLTIVTTEKFLQVKPPEIKQELPDVEEEANETPVIDNDETSTAVGAENEKTQENVKKIEEESDDDDKPLRVRRRGRPKGIWKLKLQV